MVLALWVHDIAQKLIALVNVRAHIVQTILRVPERCLNYGSAVAAQALKAALLGAITPTPLILLAHAELLLFDIINRSSVADTTLMNHARLIHLTLVVVHFLFASLRLLSPRRLITDGIQHAPRCLSHCLVTR